MKYLEVHTLTTAIVAAVQDNINVTVIQIAKGCDRTKEEKSIFQAVKKDS